MYIHYACIQQERKHRIELDQLEFPRVLKQKKKKSEKKINKYTRLLLYILITNYIFL